jgi:hypothetical protein
MQNLYLEYELVVRTKTTSKLLNERVIKNEHKLDKIENAVENYLKLKIKHPNLMFLFALNDDTDKFNKAKAISQKLNIINHRIDADR